VVNNGANAVILRYFRTVSFVTARYESVGGAESPLICGGLFFNGTRQFHTGVWEKPSRGTRFAPPHGRSLQHKTGVECVSFWGVK
jgi:hypothetical protein